VDAPNVLIRLARPDDWERVRDIRLRSLADTPNAYGSTIELEAAYGQPEWVAWIEGWEGATNVMYLADADGASVGMAVGSREGDEQDAHLYAMWVDPAWRTRGVGSRLVHEVLAWGRSWGSRWVILGGHREQRRGGPVLRAIGVRRHGRATPPPGGQPAPGADPPPRALTTVARFGRNRPHGLPPAYEPK